MGLNGLGGALVPGLLGQGQLVLVHVTGAGMGHAGVGHLEDSGTDAGAQLTAHTLIIDKKLHQGSSFLRVWVWFQYARKKQAL